MKTYQYEQLDPDTKAYLRAVRDGQGRGAPGVYFAFRSHRATWAIILGPFLLLLLLGMGYTSTKAGWAVAMLQTAGVLLGGWLIAFAIRRWTANPDKFAGHFAYFDPEHAFYGMGEEIQVADLGRAPDVDPRGENLIRFNTDRGAFTVPAPNRLQAQYVADFYEAVKWVRSRDSGPWVGLSAAEAGAVARFLVEEDREPNSLADTGLAIPDIPDRVSTVRGPSFGLVRYLVLLGVGAGAFAFFASSNPSVLDDMAYERATEAVAEEKAKNANPAEKAINRGFTGAYAVRDYLLNDKHIRHRKEAEELLSGLYAGPIDQLGRSGNADPALRVEVIRLLEILRTVQTPAVSFRVSVGGAELTGDRGKQVQSLFADGFGAAIGKDLVLGTVAGEGKKANVEVSYQRDQNTANFRWVVEVRARYDQKEPARAEGTVFLPFAGNPAFPPKQQFGFGEDAWSVDEPLKNVLAEDDAVYQAVMTKLVGHAPPRPMAD